MSPIDGEYLPKKGTPWSTLHTQLSADEGQNRISCTTQSCKYGISTKPHWVKIKKKFIVKGIRQLPHSF